MSQLLFVTIPSPPSLFRLLSLSRSRLSEAECRPPGPGLSARALADADLARLKTFGSWQALSAELRQRSAEMR